MNLNRNWINEEFVDLSHVSDKEYVETLTVFGQKVETYERMRSKMSRLVALFPSSAMRIPIICGSAR